LLLGKDGWAQGHGEVDNEVYLPHHVPQTQETLNPSFFKKRDLGEDGTYPPN
jgi:hypothetical protein